MNLFDICVITASNPRQAETFRMLLDRRVKHGLYPREIDFLVYSDPEGGRIGSGGGTIFALYSLYTDYGEQDDFFEKNRILIIHAGGESNRMPVYAPEGKLFAPVPVPSSSVIPPVVLDMQLALYLKYPWRTGEVVISSGDVVIDFDTSSVPRDRGDICGFAKPAPVEQGSRHGVFQFDKNQNTVTDYFQKASKNTLIENACIEGTNDCPLDIGIVSLSPPFIDALFSFAHTEIMGGEQVIKQLKAGRLSIDLYLEILTACLDDISQEEFSRRVNSKSTLDPKLLSELFTLLNPFTLAGVLTRQTTFTHFGTLSELADSCLELHNKGLLPFYGVEGEELQPEFSQNRISFNNWDVKVAGPGTAYIEGCKNGVFSTNEGTAILVGLKKFSPGFQVPDDVCIEERGLGEKEKVRLVYGINDTFKPREFLEDIIYCGIPMTRWLDERDLKPEDIWENNDSRELNTAKLFIPDTDSDFLQGYWSKEEVTKEWVERFKNSMRYSINELNELSDVDERERRRIEFRKRKLREQIDRNLGWKNISAADFAGTFSKNDLSRLRDFFERTDNNLLRSYRHSLLKKLDDDLGRNADSKNFDIAYISETEYAHRLKKGVKDDQIVWARSPVRFDLAGGWSDTPPYTLHWGGQVTNLAVDLNGQPPVQVFCRPTVDFKIAFHSIDLGTTEVITEFQQLEDYNNPASPFALPKGAFQILGLTSENFHGQSLPEALKEIGAGLELTLLCAVPKGSGLGTSSILGATILKALHRYFDLKYTDQELYRQVLQLEQLLTTGGGWQDQIGGVAGGVKYIESTPDLKPNPIVHQLDPGLFLKEEYARRYTLFYTGVTRLAKNILQDVVDQVQANTPAYRFTLQTIRQLAEDARKAIALRDYEELASIVNQSWRANKFIHPSTTNEEIEAMLAGVEGWYSGMKLLGAGGGGYALFMSTDWEQAETLKETLRKNHENNKARLVDFSLNQEGLQVSVS